MQPIEVLEGKLRQNLALISRAPHKHDQDQKHRWAVRAAGEQIDDADPIEDIPWPTAT
jgi:hypothetical protein